MRHWYNPTEEMIETWAYDKEALEPEQDWDIIISGLPYDDLFMKLASSDDCPKRDYFLSILYLVVGDAVRTGYKMLSGFWKLERENFQSIGCTFGLRDRGN